MDDVNLEETRGLSDEGLALFKIRHSLSHVLAQAVLSFYPTARLGFGPPVENGFYYDFDFEQPISNEDLPKIEQKMKEILRQKQNFKYEACSPDQAIDRLKGTNQTYKLEHAERMRDRGVEVISFYESGPFTDVCEGPHVRNTVEIPKDAFKLDTIAGAYWRGDEKNKMLTRIYGLAFLRKEELQDFMARRKLAAERDHRKLGKELDLFHIEEDIGRGLPLWLPNGAIVREEIEKYAKELEFLHGYQRVCTPHISKEALFYRSGHLPYYADDMYPAIEINEESRQERYYLKPMNCPFHHMTFLARRHSYRELPLRLAEYGTVYRYEKSGQLSGLSRVRMLSMNDAHIYLSEEQIGPEIERLLKIYDECYTLFGFDDYTLRLSLHDPANKDKYYDDAPMWARAESYLEQALQANGRKFVRSVGEAAFYGPKIDFQFKNVLGKEETVSTIQLDFLATRKFDLKYTGADGREHDCVVIHRSPLSTHERLVSYLIEKYGGVFPTWLSPIQVRVVPVVDEVADYAREIRDLLHKKLVRVDVDDSSDSLGKKIRNCTIRKIPIALVIGGREKENRQVTVRRYQINEQKQVALEQFVDELLTEIRERHFFAHLRAKAGAQATETPAAKVDPAEQGS